MYIIPAAVRLLGSLEVAALERSLNEIVARHEALRTSFPLLKGQPIQSIHPHVHLEIPILDVSALPEEQRAVVIQQIIQEEVGSTFDLARGPLLRVRLLRVASQEHILLLAMHHSVSDGWSKGVLFHELSTLYQAFVQDRPSPLAPLPVQYTDFTLWQRESLQGERLAAQLAYWQEQLAGAPMVLSFPIDRPRPAVMTYRGARQAFTLSRSLTASLNALSQQEGVTLFMTLLAAWQVLLWRYSGQDDLLVGTPIANRTHEQLEGLIGCFVNTLVLRCDLSGDPGFKQLLERVREMTLQAYAHQDLPFEQLVEALQPQRDLSHAPVIQYMFVLQNAPVEKLHLPGLRLEPLEIEQETARFELMLTLLETTQGLQAVLEYNTALFEATTIAHIAEYYEQLLQNIVVAPEQSISRLPLLSTQQQEQVLILCNPVPLVSWQERGLHALFEEQVEQRPDAIALVFEDHRLTYGELNAQANRLAHQLQARGVGPDVRVRAVPGTLPGTADRHPGGAQGRRRLRATGPGLSGGPPGVSAGRCPDRGVADPKTVAGADASLPGPGALPRQAGGRSGCLREQQPGERRYTSTPGLRNLHLRLEPVSPKG